MDELWSGVAVSGAPSVEHELALSHQGYLAFAFALPLVAAAAIEAAFALLSDVWGRARLVVLGQAALAAALLFTAWTSSAWGLTVGLGFAGASSGVACGAGQALLVAAERGDRGAIDRVLVRWALFGAIGDVLTPPVTAAAIALGHSYRVAMAATGLVVAVQCAVSAAMLRGSRLAEKLATEAATDADSVPEPPEQTHDEKRASIPPTLGAALRRAVRLPRLWGWLFAAASCTLLDELVVALAVLRRVRDEGSSAALATAAALSFAVGSVLGAAVTDRAAARVGPQRLLVASAIVCALALGAFLGTHGLLASCLALLVVGVSCAPHHPLALARAYGELPDHPGTVQAMAQLFVVVDVVAPLGLGLAADRFGLGVALGCLVVQPAVVALCAALLGREGDA